MMEPNESMFYKGSHILLSHGQYIVSGRIFPSLPCAQHYIDSRLILDEKLRRNRANTFNKARRK